eukprot:gene4262-4827_t
MGATFDGYPVIPIPVESKGRNNPIPSADDIVALLAAPVRDIKGGKHKSSIEEFQFLVTHADRRRNEIRFSKCQFLGGAICDYCAKSPVKCEKALETVKQSGGKMFEPTPSPEYEDLAAVPFAALGTVHPKLKRNGTIGLFITSISLALHHSEVPVGKHICHHNGCNRVFKSYHQLNKHRKTQTHFRNKRKPAATREKVAEASKRARNNITSHFQITNPTNPDQNVSIENRDDQAECGDDGEAMEIIESSDGECNAGRNSETGDISDHSEDKLCAADSCVINELPRMYKK